VPLANPQGNAPEAELTGCFTAKLFFDRMLEKEIRKSGKAIYLS
jgi:hypothetical protein